MKQLATLLCNSAMHKLVLGLVSQDMRHSCGHRPTCPDPGGDGSKTQIAAIVMHIQNLLTLPALRPADDPPAPPRPLQAS
eukprot:2720577-Amphidinium_carterae.2